MAVQIDVNINITFSKIVAFILLVLAFIVDIKEGGIAAIIVSMPFVVALITGKQIIDYKKTRYENSDSPEI